LVVTFFFGALTHEIDEIAALVAVVEGRRY
jgi:hypothetical protein